MAVLGGGFVLLAAAIGASLTCDEQCGQGPGWRHDSSAWQWDAQLWLAVVAAGAMLAGAVLLFRPDARSGAIVFGVGLFGGLGWVAWMSA